MGDLLSHNIFAYCKNNPINFEDPSGFLASSAVDFGGGGNNSPSWYNVLERYAQSDVSGIVNTVMDGVLGIVATKLPPTSTKIFKSGMVNITQNAKNRGVLTFQKATGYGIIGGLFTGISSKINISKFGWGEGSVRIGFDTAGMIGSLIIVDKMTKPFNKTNMKGLVTANVVSAGLSIATGAITNEVKEFSINTFKKVIDELRR